VGRAAAIGGGYNGGDRAAVIGSGFRAGRGANAARTLCVEGAMSERHLRKVAGWLTAAVLAGSVVMTDAGAQEKVKDLDQIPKAVMAALKSKFPNPEITKWTKAKEGDAIVYDIEFKQKGRKCEADIKENGDYINYEKEVAVKDLPAAVTKTLEKRYPKAKLLELMEITEVKGKQEILEGYEIVLTTAAGKETEITIAPDGKVLEDSGEAKKEKKK
jgi:hypothetical protein